VPPVLVAEPPVLVAEPPVLVAEPPVLVAEPPVLRPPEPPPEPPVPPDPPVLGTTSRSHAPLRHTKPAPHSVAVWHSATHTALGVPGASTLQDIKSPELRQIAGANGAAQSTADSQLLVH
jgi:hypothetical protein